MTSISSFLLYARVMGNGKCKANPNKTSIYVPIGCTVEQLKLKIASELHLRDSNQISHLLFGGQPLKSSARKLHEFGVHKECLISVKLAQITPDDQKDDGTGKYEAAYCVVHVHAVRNNNSVNRNFGDGVCVNVNGIAGEINKCTNEKAIAINETFVLFERNDRNQDQDQDEQGIRISVSDDNDTLIGECLVPFCTLDKNPSPFCINQNNQYDGILVSVYKQIINPNSTICSQLKEICSQKLPLTQQMLDVAKLHFAKDVLGQVIDGIELKPKLCSSELVNKLLFLLGSKPEIDKTTINTIVAILRYNQLIHDRNPQAPAAASAILCLSNVHLIELDLFRYLKGDGSTLKCLYYRPASIELNMINNTSSSTDSLRHRSLALCQFGNVPSGINALLKLKHKFPNILVSFSERTVLNKHIFERNKNDNYQLSHSSFFYRCDNAHQFNIREQLLQKIKKLGHIQNIFREFTISDLLDILTTDNFNKLADQALHQLMLTQLAAKGSHKSKNKLQVHECPNCKLEFIFDDNNPDSKAKEYTQLLKKLTDTRSKKLSRKQQNLFARSRIRCINAKCNRTFCLECSASPYHLGYTCKQLAEKLRAQNECRFCRRAVRSRKNKNKKNKNKKQNGKSKTSCCNSPECQQKLSLCSNHVFECGHASIVHKLEPTEQYCNYGMCKTDQPNKNHNHISMCAEDDCSLCQTNALYSGPCVTLSCGHVFHHECLVRRLQTGSNQHFLEFSFTNCPLCSQPINVQHTSLAGFVIPLRKLEKQIKALCLQQLHKEGRHKDEQLIEKFANNEQEYAMHLYAYYECYQCRLPYFGGAKQCRPQTGQISVNIQELICSACRGLKPPVACEKHDLKFVAYKCKYCCSKSVYHCWGAAHFCRDCHVNGLWEQKCKYLTGQNIKEIEEYPQCAGIKPQMNALILNAKWGRLTRKQKNDALMLLKSDPDKCPQQMTHPPSGIEHCYDCEMCIRQAREQRLAKRERAQQLQFEVASAFLKKLDNGHSFDFQHPCDGNGILHYFAANRDANPYLNNLVIVKAGGAHALNKHQQQLIRNMSRAQLKRQERATATIAASLSKLQLAAIVEQKRGTINSTSNSNSNSTSNSTSDGSKHVSWFSVDFRRCYIHPTYCSLRCNNKTKANLPNWDWVLEGSTDGKQWLRLKVQNNDSLPSCTAWPIKLDGLVSQCAFKVFRVRSLTNPPLSLHHFSFEMYGQLYTEDDGFQDKFLAVQQQQMDDLQRKYKEQWCDLTDYARDCHLPFAGQDFDENGILYFLGSSGHTKQWSNPAEGNVVKVSCSQLGENSIGMSAFVGRDAVRCVTASAKQPWMMLDFGNFSIQPTHYALKHYKSWNSECLRNWKLQCTNLDSADRWRTVHTHSNDTALKGKGSTHTWKLEADRCSRDYRKWRILQTGPNSKNHHFLACSGIEFYGVLKIFDNEANLQDDDDEYDAEEQAGWSDPEDRKEDLNLNGNGQVHVSVIIDCDRYADIAKTKPGKYSFDANTCLQSVVDKFEGLLGTEVHLWLKLEQLKFIYIVSASQNRTKANVSIQDIDEQITANNLSNEWVEVPDDQLCNLKLSDVRLNVADNPKSAIVVERQVHGKWPIAENLTKHRDAKFVIGDIVDILDNNRHWYEAVVCSSSQAASWWNSTPQCHLVVHYIGHDVRWDEKFSTSPSSGRIAPRGSMSMPHKSTKFAEQHRKHTRSDPMGKPDATKRNNRINGNINRIMNCVSDNMVGLRNLGNTCFMNSSIQCCAQMPWISDYFLSGEFKADVNHNNPLGYKGRVAQVWSALLKQIFNTRNSCVSPQRFKSTMGSIDAKFLGYSQQDSHELISILLGALHEDVNRVKQKPALQPLFGDQYSDLDQLAYQAWQMHRSRNQSVIVDRMHALTKTEIICGRCRTHNISFEPYVTLSVPFPVRTKRHKTGRNNSRFSRSVAEIPLSDCLDAYTQPNEPNGQCWCENCQTMTPSETKLHLYNTPDVLVLHLKRFTKNMGSYSRSGRNCVWYRDDTRVQIPVRNFDLGKWLLSKSNTIAAGNSNSNTGGAKSTVYDLFAVSNHSGGTQGGHYTAEAKNLKSNVWYSLNDYHCSTYQQSNSNFCSSGAYVLFYKRRTH